MSAAVQCSTLSCCSYEPGIALAESCVVCGRHPPRFLFFAASGSLCNVAQLVLDRALLALLPHDVWWIPTACWTLSYTLSVSLRHYSHALCVFGRHADPMCIALGKTYLTYMSTIVASTAVNLALVGVSRRTAHLPLPPQHARPPVLTDAWRSGRCSR
jgi:hypothetical protein